MIAGSMSIIIITVPMLVSVPVVIPAMIIIVIEVKPCRADEDQICGGVDRRTEFEYSIEFTKL
jgi:hypothetical protein